MLKHLYGRRSTGKKSQVSPLVGGKPLFEQLEERCLLAPLVSLGELPVEGGSVAVDGEYAVVANTAAFADDAQTAQTGAAFVLKRDTKNTQDPLDDQWNQVAKLVPSNQNLNTPFDTVAIEGNTIAVRGSNTSTHVYEMPAGGWSGTQTETTILSAFGSGSLYVANSTVFLGASIFVEPTGGWSSWVSGSPATAQLVESLGGFAIGTSGLSVNRAGDTIAVLSRSGFNSPTPYVFTEPSAGWSGDVTPAAELGLPSDIVDDPSLLSTTLLSTSISNDIVALSISPFYEDFVPRGEVLIYGQGDSWSGTEFVDARLRLRRELQNSECDPFFVGPCWNFGKSLLLNEERILVGAPNISDGDFSAGKFYRYEKPSAGWVNDVSANQQIKGDPPSSSNDFFGDTNFGRWSATDDATYLFSSIDRTTKPKVYVPAPQGTPPVIGDQNFNVAETATVGSVVGTLVASDPDPGDTALLNFNIISGNESGVFALNPSTGEITVAAGLDHETTGQYTLLVDVADPTLNTAVATVVINIDDVNEAPTFSSPTTVSIPENSQTVHSLTANDEDLPAQTITFSISGSGADNGLFEVVGSDLQFKTAPDFESPTDLGGVAGDNVYKVSVQADDGFVGTTSQTITVTVDPVNDNAPVLDPTGDQTIDEQTVLTFTATATDADLPTNGLTFSLDAGAPVTASINSSTGVFSWTPTEADGPGTFNVTVRVTDDGTPTLDDFETLTITVNEVNVAPVLDPTGDQTIDEQTELTFTAIATDADLPANSLVFSLDVGAPATASIDPTTGAFSWMPTESDGPGTFDVTVRVTDDGSPALDDFETIEITVNEVNVAPVLAGIGNQTIDELTELTFTVAATDDDHPANGLAFSLDPGAPATASIDSTTGAFSWMPTEADGPGTFDVTVRVTDDGTPALDASETLTITVNEVNTAPTITSPNTANVAENTLLVHTLTANDEDLPAQSITFSISGSGADNGLFEIINTDELQFVTAPDFENPADTNSDNVYEVSVLAKDGNGGVTPQTIWVTVTDVVDPQTYVVDIATDENDDNFDAGDLSLREAIALANADDSTADTITFDASLAGRTLLLTGQLDITAALTITGLGADQLTIDAGNGNDGIFGTQDGFRIFNIDDGDNNNSIEVQLSGITLTGGDGGGGGAIVNRENLDLSSSTISKNAATGSRGGGIFNYGTLTLTNSTISENRASFGGGVLNRGTATIISSSISENHATNRGGGIRNDSALSALFLTNSTLSGNRSGGGGGIDNLGTTTVSSSTISNNFGAGHGGGISNSATSSGSATLTIENSSITGNTATGNSNSVGGGIYSRGFNGLHSATTTVNFSTISGNSASRSGGGIHSVIDTLAITSSTISGNSSGLSGGGISLHPSSEATINMSTISENTSDFSAGGIFAGGSITITSSTITGNRADADNNGSGSVGGIQIGISFSPVVTLSHTLVAGNATGGGLIVDISGAVHSTSEFNLIGNGNGLSGIMTETNGNLIGTSILPIDPLLGPLANNGGPTHTHALLPGSPAIDMGNPAISSPPANDQRGAPFVRVFGAAVDIGAFETQTPRIVDVIVAGSSWADGSISEANFIDAVDGGGEDAGNGLGFSLVGSHQITSLPWGGIDTVYLVFSEDVFASIADGEVLLSGTNGGTYALGSLEFETNDPSIVAVPINGGIAIDSLVLSIFDGTVTGAAGIALDGEWTSGQESPSGNSTAGGQFDFFFNVLPGDEDVDGVVKSFDALNIFASNTSAPTKDTARRDFDGSGFITASDALAAFANNTSGLPTQSPTPPSAVAAAVAPVGEENLTALDALFSIMPAADQFTRGDVRSIRFSAEPRSQLETVAVALQDADYSAQVDEAMSKFGEGEEDQEEEPRTSFARRSPFAPKIRSPFLRRERI